MHRAALAIATLSATLLFAGCGSKGTGMASVTPPPAATATATVDVTASLTPAATGTVASVATATPASARDGRRLSDATGIADVDAVLAALASGEAVRVAALFEAIPSPCVVKPQGIHNPPACPDGVAAGTLLPVARASAGEAVWPGDLERVLAAWLGREQRVFAVIFEDLGLPGWSSYAQIARGHIVSFAFDGNTPPSLRLMDLSPVRVIVPPPP